MVKGFEGDNPAQRGVVVPGQNRRFFFNEGWSFQGVPRAKPPETGLFHQGDLKVISSENRAAFQGFLLISEGFGTPTNSRLPHQ